MMQVGMVNEMSKKILLCCAVLIGGITFFFIALKLRKPNWFIERVKNGKYTVEGDCYGVNLYDESIKEVSIKIKDNNKELIVFESSISSYGSNKPREDNYSIKCTDEYIVIYLKSDDEKKYMEDKENYKNRKFEGDEYRFYYEDLEKISNQ